MIISPKLFLEREMLQARVVDKIKTHILCSIHFFPKIMHKNIVEPERPQMTIYCVTENI
jgi:hypothetical protein